MTGSKYYIYMLRCEDESIYTGSTGSLERRINEHLSASPKASKYTRSHKAVKLEAAFSCESKNDALRLEYRIKQLKKPQKESIVESKCLDVLSDKLDIKIYHAVDI